jgi:hypothetical protein
MHITDFQIAMVKHSKNIGSLSSICWNMARRKNLSVENVRRLSKPDGEEKSTCKYIVLKWQSSATSLTILNCFLMKSLDVNSNMKNLMNVVFRRDVEIDFASIDMMKVEEIKKLGSVQT